MRFRPVRRLYARQLHGFNGSLDLRRQHGNLGQQGNPHPWFNGEGYTWQREKGQGSCVCRQGGGKTAAAAAAAGSCAQQRLCCLVS